MNLRLFLALVFVVLCGCDVASNAVRTLDPDASEKADVGPPPRFAGLMRDPRPTLQIGLVRQGMQSRMVQESVDGPFVRYLSIDRAAIVLNDGLLHSLFGFGDGLMGADVAETLAKLQSGTEGSVTRRHTYLTAEDTTQVRVFSCLVTYQGPSKVAQPSGAVPTSLYFEDCREPANNTTFQNQYWYDPNSKQVIQSLQWVGDTFGAISTRFTPE